MTQDTLLSITERDEIRELILQQGKRQGVTFTSAEIDFISSRVIAGVCKALEERLPEMLRTIRE